MELTRHYVEDLVYDGGRVDVADLFANETNQFQMSVNIARGSYGCYIYTDDENTVWVCQIASTEPKHREFLLENIHNEELWEDVGFIGVDSGYAGFFDKKPKLTLVQRGKLLDWMAEDPDDLAFTHDFSDENDPTPNDGFWSASGEGEGMYSVYALSYEGEFVAVEIRFNETMDFCSQEKTMTEFERSYQNMMEKLTELTHRVQLGVSHETISANIDQVRRAAIVLRETYNTRKDISVDVGFAKLTAEPCCSDGGDPNGIVIGYTDENGVWTQDLAMVSVETANNDVATVRVWSDENNEGYTDFFAVGHYEEEKEQNDEV